MLDPVMRELTFTDLAELEATTPAAVARRNLALEALEDHDWVRTYEQRLSGGLRPLEQIPVYPDALVEAHRNAVDTPVDDKARPSTRSDLVAAVGGAAFIGLSALNPFGSRWVAFLTTGLSLTWVLVMAAASAATWMAIHKSEGNARLKVLAATTLVAAGLHPFAPLLALAAHAFHLIRIRRGAGPSDSNTASGTRPNRDSAYQRTSWGAPTTSLASVSFELQQRSVSYGLTSSEPSDIDIVTAVLGAEVWFAATGADSFEQSASFGVATTGALAAIYARAAGTPAPHLGVLEGQQTWPALEHRLRSLQDGPVAWSIRLLGPEATVQALHDAAGDLTWGGGGDDRCARAARWIRENAATLVTSVGSGR